MQIFNLKKIYRIDEGFINGQCFDKTSMREREDRRVKRIMDGFEK